MKISSSLPCGTNRAPLQVAVGVIKNTCGQILISLRDPALHQGGRWEFPGGKVEPGETTRESLARELKEELDIVIESANPLITISHDYPDRSVQLHVYETDNFSGEAKSCEGQPFRWVNPEELVNYTFPEANRPIISAARLPSSYAILDDAEPGLLLTHLNKLLDQGIKLIQARLKTLSLNDIGAFLETAMPLCKASNAKLLLNSASAGIGHFGVDGIHLTSSHLMAAVKRPRHNSWVTASCHNLEELVHAQKIGVDFVVLAPVLSTPTHPDAPTLGWERFSALVSHVNLPVYALGGLSRSDIVKAREAGGQGIAGIRAFL